jgi:undecaprenyl-diphosphatase
MPSHTTRRWTAAWFVAVAVVTVYAVMWLGYRQDWAWLDCVDSSALGAGHDVGVKHSGWVRFWDAVCTMFGPTTFRLLGAAAAAVALTKRRLRAALFVVVTVELSGLVTLLAKGLAGRPRPATALVAASSTSFPSGHALEVMVGVAALLTVTLPLLNHSVRVVAVVVGVLTVVAVGIGRVALNVHHPSDVLAGWALGYLYFLVFACLLRPSTMVQFAVQTRRASSTLGLISMTDITASPDPIGEFVCSRKGCRATATWGLLWNNPKIHTPERRKVWLTCGDHREYLSEYLSVRGFLKQVVPADQLEGTHEG